MSNGAGDRSRTYDVLITSEVLYQLSYTGTLTFNRLYQVPAKAPTQTNATRKVAIGDESYQITGGKSRNVPEIIGLAWIRLMSWFRV